MIDRFGPGVGHLNYLALPGVGIFAFLFVPVVGRYLTSISLRETETECSSRIAHARYISCSASASWRSSKLRTGCVNFLFFFLFLPFLFLHFLSFCCSDCPTSGLASSSEMSEKASWRQAFFYTVVAN